MPPRSAISPTLMRLAARPPRRGFTLIEILIAIGISTVIVLTAVSAFRAAMEAIGSARRLSIENSLLRAGYDAAMDDVDFFHSEANDADPYRKGFTRRRTLRADDPGTSENDTIIRRHFQPVRFMTATDPDTLPFESADPTNQLYTRADPAVANPNVFLAHDARSIDRAHLYSATTPDGFRGLSPKFVFGDYRLVAATDMRTDAAAIGPSFAVDTDAGPAAIPLDLDRINTDTAAWNPPALPPSYKPKLTAEVTEHIPIPLDMGNNQALPLFYWQLFNRLSLIGVTEYLSCGVNAYIQDQGGRVPDAALAAGPNGTMIGATSPWGFAESRVQSRLDLIYYDHYREGSRDFANLLGCTFGQYGVWALATAPVLGVPDPALGGGWDEYGVMVQLVQFGDRSGNGTTTWTMASTAAGGYAVGVDQDTGNIARNDRFFTSRTVRLPYNLTDGERCLVDPSKWIHWNNNPGDPLMVARYKPVALDYTTRPDKYPVLATSTLRYRRMGGMGQLALAVISVEDPVSGQKIELPCCTYGTTYRGARQHWRLYSPGYADQRAIGDFYDDAPGPLYAP